VKRKVTVPIGSVWLISIGIVSRKACGDPGG
jgi:hypothetical protein